MEDKDREAEIKEEIKELKDKIEALKDDEEAYNDFIDDSTGDITIMGMEFTPSTILKELDPIAYNCGHSYFIDSELSELNTQIEELEEELKGA